MCVDATNCIHSGHVNVCMCIREDVYPRTCTRLHAVGHAMRCHATNMQRDFLQRDASITHNNRMHPLATHTSVKTGFIRTHLQPREDRVRARARRLPGADPPSAAVSGQATPISPAMALLPAARIDVSFLGGVLSF